MDSLRELIQRGCYELAAHRLVYGAVQASLPSTEDESFGRADDPARGEREARESPAESEADGHAT